MEAQCSSLAEYSGSAKLVINEGEDYAFSGAKSFNFIKLEKDASLLLCGSWTVSNDVDIKENALLELNGSMSVGSNKKQKEIKVEKGATFRIEGNITIYGDLILEDDSTIEFIGEDSVMNIFGEVDMGDDVTVSGVFEDVRNRF